MPAPVLTALVLLFAKPFALPMQIMLMGSAAFLLTALSWRARQVHDAQWRLVAWACVAAYILLALGFDALQDSPGSGWGTWKGDICTALLLAGLLQACVAVAWAPARSYPDGAGAFALPLAAFLAVRFGTQQDWGYAYDDAWAVKVVYAPWLWPLAWWLAQAGNPAGGARHLAATAGVCLLTWFAWLAWEFSASFHWLTQPWSTIPHGGWVNILQSLARIALLLVSLGMWLVWLRPRTWREASCLAGVLGAVLAWAWLVPWAYELPT